MRKLVCVGVVCLVGMSGCLHGRGVHSVPSERDYKDLADVKIPDSQPLVDKAHRVGAHHFAPYEAASAKKYQKFAYEARAEGDRKGHKDYAGLAKKYAEAAIADGSGIEDKGEMPMLDNKEAALEEWNRLHARYQELDPCKAKVVAPHIYAHLEANLAQAEHEIMEHCNTPDAVRHMRLIEADIDAIWAHDYDGDGITDMHDGEPWKAEDKDGFQDEDGIPEPKPYPTLDNVYFASASAKLSDHAQGYLNGIADMLNDGYKEVTIYIQAHTDQDASDDYNMELSAKREKSVKDYLVSQGVSASRIQSKHFGETKLADSANTAAAKAKNRRVELRLDAPDPTSPFCN